MNALKPREWWWKITTAPPLYELQKKGNGLFKGLKIHVRIETDTYTFQGAFQKRAYRKMDVLNITPYQIILRKSRLHLLSFHLPKIIFSKRLAGRRPYYSTKILMQLLVKDKQDPSLGQGADISCLYRHFPAECYSATGMYLEAIQLLVEAFYDNNMSPEKRMYQAWFAKTFRGRLQRTSAKISDFQTTPLPLSGCVRISKTTPPSPDVRVQIFQFLFLLIKTKFIAQ